MMEQIKGAKYDEGKPRPSLVPVEAITTIMALQEYEHATEERKKPKLLCKTRKEGYAWKGLFECPYCGESFEAYISNVMQGKQHSCGCMKGAFSIESKGTHGGAGTRLYRVYRHIVERCNSENCKEYKWYGARGIRCEFETFEEFRDFAYSHGYNDSLTCERIDVNGNYSKDNVTFIPLEMQAQNTRSNVKINYKGLTLCAAEWARIIGMNQDTLTKRIRTGWSSEKALETPVKGHEAETVDISLIPLEAIEAIREARLYGLSKYKDAEDWRKVPREKWLDALLRHVLRIWNNPLALDDESALPALWHVITNAAFLCAAYKDDIDEFYAYANEWNEELGERWDKMVQSALNNPIAKDIHVDWVWTGPGPDPRGEEGDLGPGVTKEVQQCEDASGRGND